MNRQKLQALASEWTRVAKNDIRQKINDFMQETDASRRELAYMLGISDGELEQILTGNCELTISTFAKLLIATGNALEIKPIEETPIGNYDNIPEGPMPPMPPFGRMPRPNPFARPSMTERPFQRQEPVIEDDFDNEMEDEQEEFMPPREPRFVPRRPILTRPMAEERNRPQGPVSPFATMSRDKLVGIIRKKLWDSEIDIDRAHTLELVKFLEEKDKRMKEYQRSAELENDPKVQEFKNRLKKTVNDNPHLKEWVRKLISGVDE